MSSKNDYLLSHALNGDDRPLRYTYLENLRPSQQFFFIQADDGEIIAAAVIRNFPMLHEENSTALTSLCVVPEHWEKGFGKSLLWAVMQYANQHRLTLHMGSFEPIGWERLAIAIPKLHRQFPDLKVTYYHSSLSAMGERDYILAGEALTPEIEFV